MKKIIALLLALTMVFALVACASTEKPAETPADNQETEKPAEQPEETPAEQPEETPAEQPEETPAAAGSGAYASALQRAIAKGLKEQAAELTEQMLADTEPLQIIQDEIIPALDIVGQGFEEKRVYLPQLLMAAEAAKASFEKIKARMSDEHTASKCPVVIATVHGDIHDIGKNIVRLLLENYGFEVIDLSVCESDSYGYKVL